MECSLVNLAALKDSGFDTPGFLGALSSLRRFTSTDLGIVEAEYERLRSTVAAWRSVVSRSEGREPPDCAFDR